MNIYKILTDQDVGKIMVMISDEVDNVDNEDDRLHYFSFHFLPGQYTVYFTCKPIRENFELYFYDK